MVPWEKPESEFAYPGAFAPFIEAECMLPLISLPRFFASHRALIVPKLCPIT